MLNSVQKLRGLLPTVLVVIPVFSLALSLISWLTYGVDLPFYDDWRVFDYGTALSLEPKDLTMPANDTLYPVGMALDALAQRYLSGNSIAYQFTSMVGLLGLLLWLQWRLLHSALGSKLLAASAFSLCVFMLQPGSYWGIQNLAYHQGLPVLCLIGSIAVILDRNWSAWWGIPGVAVLGLLSGFSYISGAFCAFVAASVLLGLAALSKTPYRRALAQGGIALLVVSCVTVAAQLWVIFTVQRGHIHDSRAPWAFPTDADFWFFLLGKIGRSLVLPHTSPVASLVLVGLACAITISLAVWFLFKLAAGHFETRQDSKVGIVLVTLLFVVASYLALLSAGRANLRPDTISKPLKVFSFGFINYYHFFWITILWPWIAAATFVVAKDWRYASFARFPVLPLMFPVIAIPYAVIFGAFDHPSYYRDFQTRRINTQVRCLQEALDNGGPIICPALYAADLTKPFLYGLSIQSSFARYFPLRPIPIGSAGPAPLFRLSQGPSEALSLVNIVSSKRTAEKTEFEAKPDPILIVRAPAGQLRQCLVLEMSMLVRARIPDRAQMFFTTPGQSDFTEQESVSAPVGGSEAGFTKVTLRAQSFEGFGDSVRIDPVGEGQNFMLNELELRCRLKRQ